MTKRSKRQYSSEIVNLESMIPENHFLRVIEKYFDWNFIYDEVEKIAYDISTKVRDENYRYNDLMVVTRNVEAYESIFKMIFERYEIPYFIDSKSELSLQPLVCLVLSLLDICNKGFQTQDVITYLKTGLSNVTDINDIDKLENYVLKYGIKGNRWLSKWDYDSEEINNYINNLLKNNLFEDKLVKGARDCFIGKRIAIKLHADTITKTIRVMFVPSLEFVYEPFEDRVDELKKIMVDIDILAQEANIPIIMGAQLNRDTKNLKNLCNQVISDSGWIERKASEILLIWSSKEKGEALTEKDLEELGAVKKTDRGWETMKLGIDGELYLKLTKSRNIPTNTTAVLSINGNTGRVTGNAERRITAEEQSLDLSDGQEQQEPAGIPLPPDYDPNPEDQYPRRGKYGNDEEEEIEHPGAAPDGLPF